MKCVCASLMPGMTTRRPASMTRVFSPFILINSSWDPTATMRSPRMAIASALGCFGSSVAMRPLTISVSAGSAGMRVLQPDTAARPTLPLRKSRREAIRYLLVLRLELDAGGLRLREDQRGEILLGHALPDHLLQQIARQRGERHRHLELAARVEAQVEVLAQELRREGDVEVEVDQRRCLVAREHRAHHALVEEVEEGVARHAGLLREDGDLAQVLDYHAEHHVVADLGDASELALADVARAGAHHVEVRLRLLVRRLRARDDEGQLPCLDDLCIPADRRRQVLDVFFFEDFS